MLKNTIHQAGADKNNKKTGSKIRTISYPRDSKPKTSTEKKMSYVWVLALFVPCVLGGVVNPQENEVFTGRSEHGSIDVAFKLLADCQKMDFGTCMGIKAVTLMNRVARMDEVKILDGVAFVSSGEIDRTGRALSESELENSLPEETSQKTSRLLDLFLDAALRFFKSHTLQFRLPESAPGDLKRALEEGKCGNQ